MRITTVKQRYAVAELARACSSTSPERAEPFCPVFGACGGCQLQHLSYAAQLAWKRDIVRAALERIGGLRRRRRERRHRHGAAAGIPQQDVAGGRRIEDAAADPRLLSAALARRRADRRMPDRHAANLTPTWRGLDAERTRARCARCSQDARHVVARSARASGREPS